MSAVITPCMDQVGRLFPFPLREDVARWATGWCDASVPHWIVAVGVLAWIEAASDKRDTPEALKRKEVMSELQAEIDGPNRKFVLRLLACRLYNSRVMNLDQWFEYRTHLERLAPPLSPEHFIAVFEIYARGKIRSIKELHVELDRLLAPKPGTGPTVRPR